MNLSNLVQWAKDMRDVDKLRAKTMKEADVINCLSLLKGVETRATLIIENTKRSEKLTTDIQMFLEQMAKRGLIYEEPKVEPKVENPPHDKNTGKEKGKS